MVKIRNPKAHFNYLLQKDRFEAGLSLLGAEAKSIRENRASLNEAVVRIINKQLFLINANIPVENLINYQPTRLRKLLMHRSEIIRLETAIKRQKLTMVPLALYTKGRLVKLELALGKTKRKFEKKSAVKAKDIELELEREIKQKL